MFTSSLLNRTLAAVLIPVLCVVGFILSQSSDLVSQLKGKVQSELETTLDNLEHDLARDLDVTGQLAHVLARNTGIVAAFEEHQGDRLYQWGRHMIDAGMVSRVTFVDSKGIVLARSHDEFRFNDLFLETEVIKRSSSGKAYVCLVRGETDWFFRSVAPVMLYDVMSLGVVMVEKQITEAFLKDMATGYGLDRIVPGPDGIGAKNPDPEKFLKATRIMAIPCQDPSGACRLTIVKDVQEQMSGIRQKNRKLIGLTLVATLAAVFFIYLSISYFLQPVWKMHASLNQFQNKKLSLRDLIDHLKPLQLLKSELGMIAGSVISTLHRLEHVQQNLEQMVGQRTRELETRTQQLREEVNERKKAEKEYRLVVENATEAIFLVQDGGIKFPNPRTLQFFSVSQDEIERLTFSGLIHPLDREPVLERNALLLSSDERPQTCSFRVMPRNGKERWGQLNTVSTLWENRPATLNFIRDITELKQAQEIMIQSEKLLSLGGLAAGMAHEINNPLAGMMQNAQVVIKRLSTDMPANVTAAAEVGIPLDAIRTYMEKRQILQSLKCINDAGTQAAEIVNNMLSFARRGEGRKFLQNVDEILDNALVLARNDYDLDQTHDLRRIMVEKDYSPSLKPVLCEKSKIQQVFFNILKNAAEAMADKCQETGHRNRLILKTYEDRDMSCIEIRDNGPGMDETIRKRIFEPFFTTKGVDRGTGLGLSIAYFIIVEHHGGSLEVASEPGNGAAFIIRLPLA
ncbi:MAG: ATP-binding protein [Pseudomonadota bacterium]